MRFVNDSMGVETYLLGLRFFSPALEVSDDLEQVSTTLFLWVEAVLEEFGLSVDDIFAVVTGSGSDVKRCGTAKGLLDKPWAWCAPHFLNRAQVEAAGHSETAAGTKNPPPPAR